MSADAVPLPGRRHADCEWCGLRRVCFPGRLAADAALGGNTLGIRRLRVARGRSVYRAGERIEALHMVRSGCIKELEGGGRGDAIVNFCLPGELMTVQSAGGARSRITAVAVEAAFVCLVPWRMFYRVCTHSPAATAEFIQMIARSGAGTRELLLLVRGKGAIERVAGFLANLSLRLQTRGLAGREFRLAMSREDIANHLGLRAETVSRSFSELARRRIVRVTAKRIEVLDLEELLRIASAEPTAARP
jgi:CRP/FNR family transcriptional regulator, anaerobic regulatory protein